MQQGPQQYNQTYDPRPPPGYNQQAQAPQYPQQPGYPNMQQPQYYYAAPPKQGISTGKIVTIVVVVVVLLVIISVILAGVMVVYMQTMPQGGGTVETTYGYKQSYDGLGNLTVTIMSGSARSASSVNYNLYRSTGEVDSQGSLSSIANVTLGPSSKITFWDVNSNRNADPGDVIKLWHNGPSNQYPVAAGWRLTLTRGGSVLMTVNLM
jgi:hypothetical protein